MPLDRAILERLIEVSPDIVVATAADGTVQYYNDGARENLGYSRLEIIGRYVVELYPSIDEARRVMTAMRSTEHVLRVIRLRLERYRRDISAASARR